MEAAIPVTTDELRQLSAIDIFKVNEELTQHINYNSNPQLSNE